MLAFVTNQRVNQFRDEAKKENTQENRKEGNKINLPGINHNIIFATLAKNLCDLCVKFKNTHIKPGAKCVANAI
jgi:hypothetical protein